MGIFSLTRKKESELDKKEKKLEQKLKRKWIDKSFFFFFVINLIQTNQSNID